MSLSDLASLGSFVSGLAVVVTLVFLLLQIRQTNRYQRASMQLGRVSRSQAIALRGADPELARITVRAMNCDETLSEVDTRVFASMVAAYFQSIEDTFLQHRAGLLEKASLATDEASMRVFLLSPAYRAMWRLISLAFGGEFRAYVDDILEQVDPLPVSDISPLYKMVVREELARVKRPRPDSRDHHSAVAALQEAMKPPTAN